MIFAGCFVLSLYIGWLKKASGNVWNGGGDVPRAALAIPAAVVPCGGACFVCRPPTMPLPSFLPPIPPPALAERSSPAGKGEPQSLFCRGLRPRHPCIRPFAAPTATAKRAPRGQNPRGTGYPCRCGALRGGAGGGHLLTLPLAFLLPPIPPPPLAGRSSPAGKGENQSFLMQGAPPLASSGLAPRGTGSAGVSGALRGRTGDGRRLALPPHVPGGGVPFSSPANPAFSVVSAPYPPSPLPRRGRGSPKVYFAGGFAPGTPALDRSRHLQTFPNRSPAQREVRGWSPEWQEMLFFGQCRQPRRGGTGGEELRRLRWSSPPGQGQQVPLGFSLPADTTAAGQQAARMASPAKI